MQILEAIVNRLEPLTIQTLKSCQGVAHRLPHREIGLFACTLLLMIASFSTASHGQQQATVRTLFLATSNLPPVVKADSTGYLDRILATLGQRTGIVFELRPLPAARALMQANTGALDGDVARTDFHEDQLPHLIRVPEPLIDLVVAGLYRRDGIHVEKPDDLAEYRVGYVRGWKLVESLLHEYPHFTVTRTVGQLLDMLNADRLDIAVMAVASGRLMATERGMQNLRVTDYRVRRHSFLYLHESHADLVPVIDSAIKSMKSDDSYQAIINAYNAENQ